MRSAENPPQQSKVPQATTPPVRVTRRISDTTLSGSGIRSRMGESLLDHVVGMAGRRRRSVAERRAEAVHCEVIALHPPQHRRQRHVTEKGLTVAPEEHEAAHLYTG